MHPPPTICITLSVAQHLLILSIYLYKFYYRKIMDSRNGDDSWKNLPELHETNFEAWWEIFQRLCMIDMEIFTWLTVLPLREPNFETEDMEELVDDGHGNFVLTPILKYRGVSGKMKWSALYGKNEGRRDRWASNLASIVMKIGKSVRSDLWDRVKLDAAYIEGIAERPVGLKKILAAVRKISTGHGAHSLYLDVTRLIGTKMVDGA